MTRQDKTRQDNVLFGVLYSLMYIDLNIYFMTILTLFFIRPKKLQQKYTEISNALNIELKKRRFWATHVNRKWDFFHFESPWLGAKERGGGGKGRRGSRGSNEPPLQVNDGWLKTQAVNFQLLANSSQTPPTRLLTLPNLYFFLTKNLGKKTAEEWKSPLPVEDGNFLYHDGDSHENVAWKVNLRSFNFYRNYCKSFTLSNASEPLLSRIPKNHIKFRKRKKI